MNEKKWIVNILSISIIFLLSTQLIYANAYVSMLMIFSAFHLIILNLVIGIIESLILGYLKIINRIWVIIIANYVSMIFGYIIIAPIITNIFRNFNYYNDFYKFDNNHLWFIILVFLISIITTLLIEFPFFLLSMRAKINKRLSKKENRIIRMKSLLKPFLIANVITNAFLFFYYIIFFNIWVN